MSKFQEALDRYQKEMKETLKMKDKEIDAELLRAVTKGLGPSIYREDASKVSCSDKSERDRVKNNFLIKKLGMTDSKELDDAIVEVCQKMGSGNRNKFRGIFYYLLVKKFKKESFYDKKKTTA